MGDNLPILHFHLTHLEYGTKKKIDKDKCEMVINRKTGRYSTTNEEWQYPPALGDMILLMCDESTRDVVGQSVLVAAV